MSFIIHLPTFFLVFFEIVQAFAQLMALCHTFWALLSLKFNLIFKKQLAWYAFSLDQIAPSSRIFLFSPHDLDHQSQRHL